LRALFLHLLDCMKYYFFNRNKYVAVVALVCTALVANLAAAQNINSTYSRLGIGQLIPAANVKNLGMGGVQSAMIDGNTINVFNPASYSFLDITTYQVSGHVNFLSAKTSTDKLNYNNGNLGEMSMAFRKSTSKWGFAAGLHPYSAVGYVHEQVQDVNDSLQAKYNYSGEGGMSEFSIGASRVFVIKNERQYYDSIASKRDTVNYSHLLSIGSNFNYLFGNLSQINQVTFSDIRYDGSLITKNTFARGRYVQGGFIYQAPLKLVIDKKKLVKGSYVQLGGTYTMGTDLKTTVKELAEATSYNSVGATVATDTAYVSTTSNGRLSIPQRITLGAAFRQSNAKSGTIQIGVDYTLQNWSNFAATNGDVVNNTDYMNASAITSLGFEYRPTTAMQDNLAHRMHYRLGAKYGDTHLVLNNKQIIQKSISAGITIPLMKGDSKFHISTEYSIFGTTDNNLVQENQLNLWVAFSFAPLRSKERWFYIYQYD
jgi:hypothetical protein